MVPEDTIKRQIKHVLKGTDFDLGRKYEGKVRDNYSIDQKRIIVTTDRISAFDRVLCEIPFKGQVNAFVFIEGHVIFSLFDFYLPDVLVDRLRVCAKN